MTNDKFNPLILKVKYTGDGTIFTGSERLLLNGELMDANTRYVIKDGDIVESSEKKAAD